jgi:hypothetical protein
MIFRILRHAAWPALVAAGISSACTSPPPTADAFVTSYIQGVSSTSALCPFASRKEWIDIGAPTGLKPTTVSDGGDQAGGKVSVTCSVHPNGDGFDVELNASVSSQGSITVTSNSPVTAAGGGMAVSGTFESGQSGRYASQNCTITFMYDNGKVPVDPPIKAGAIWAHLSCVDAQRGDAMVIGPDGGTSNETCDTEADFEFENCAQ